MKFIKKKKLGLLQQYDVKRTVVSSKKKKKKKQQSTVITKLQFTNAFKEQLHEGRLFSTTAHSLPIISEAGETLYVHQGDVLMSLGLGEDRDEPLPYTDVYTNGTLPWGEESATKSKTVSEVMRILLKVPERQEQYFDFEPNSTVHINFFDWFKAISK